jgi:Tfp pilus assembly protein PilZ
MSEHRSESRKKLLSFTPVYDSKTRNLLGYMGNLTVRGAMVIGERPMALNQEILLAIEFPDTLADITVPNIILHGRVAWCQLDESSPQNYNIGFEFTDATPTHTKIFQTIIDHFDFRQDRP